MKFFFGFMLTILFPTLCFGIKCLICLTPEPGCTAGAEKAKEVDCTDPEKPAEVFFCQKNQGYSNKTLFWERLCHVKGGRDVVGCKPFSHPAAPQLTGVVTCFCDTDFCNSGNATLGKSGSGEAKSLSLAAWLIPGFLSFVSLFQ